MKTFSADDLEVGVYTTAQAAKRLGVTHRTVQRWIKTGMFPCPVIRTGRKSRIGIAALEAALAGKSMNGGSE